MKTSTKILLVLGAVIICGLIFVASSSGADWSGTWQITNNDNYLGEITSKKVGNEYRVNLDIQEPTMDGSAGFCLMDQKAKEVNGNLEVYDENRVAFIMSIRGKSIKVTPVLDAHQTISWCGRYSLEIYNDDPAEKKIQMQELKQQIQAIKWSKK